MNIFVETIVVVVLRIHILGQFFNIPLLDVNFKALFYLIWNRLYLDAHYRTWTSQVFVDLFTITVNNGVVVWLLDWINHNTTSDSRVNYFDITLGNKYVQMIVPRRIWSNSKCKPTQKFYIRINPTKSTNITLSSFYKFGVVYFESANVSYN